MEGRAAAGRARTAAGIGAEEFEQIVRDHQRRIYRVVFGQVRDPDVADTLTQECFLRAYRKRASFRGDSSITTWLTRIAINLAIDHARNRRQAFWKRLFHTNGCETEAAVSAALEVADPKASPERVAAAREELQAVWAVAEGLAGHQRAAFMLRFAEDMSLEEIAETMEVEVGTVKSHLFRAVSAVRNKMKKLSSDAETQSAHRIRRGRG